MTPESLVPTRETCEAMKKAGFPQDTFFGWYRVEENPDRWVLYSQVGKHGFSGFVSAATLAEILEQIRTGATIQVWRDASGKTQSCVWSEVRVAECEQVRHANPAEAAARLWLKVNGGAA